MYLVLLEIKVLLERTPVMMMMILIAKSHLEARHCSEHVIHDPSWTFCNNPMTVVLRLDCASKSLGGLVKPECWLPFLEFLFQRVWDGVPQLTFLISSFQSCCYWGTHFENHYYRRWVLLDAHFTDEDGHNDEVYKIKGVPGSSLQGISNLNVL